MSEINSVPESLVNCPITLYFFETKDKIKGKWSFMKWLKLLDKDSFSMILESIESIQNISKDKFDPENPTNEGVDIAMLHLYVLLEEKYKNIPINFLDSVKEKAVEKLLAENDISFMLDYIAYEELRRSGMVKIKGDGRILSKKTDIEIIDNALIGLRYSSQPKKEPTSHLENISTTGEKKSFEEFEESYEIEKRNDRVSNSIIELEDMLNNFSGIKNKKDIDKILKKLYDANEICNEECLRKIDERNNMIMWTIENALSDDPKIGINDHLPYLIGKYLDLLKKFKSEDSLSLKKDMSCFEFQDLIENNFIIFNKFKEGINIDEIDADDFDEDDPADYWKKES